MITLLQELHPQTTTIQISSDVTTHVTLDAPFINLSETITVDPGVTLYTIDSSLRESSTKISFKAIRVRSDEPISIHVIDDTTPDVGGYLALPVESLGTEYMIMSFKPQGKSELLISSISDTTKVYVHLNTKSNVTYLGQTYSSGDVIRETLNTFRTWQITSSDDLTGTVIKADGLITVMSGSDCGQVPETSMACGYIVEQLPTVTSWDTVYIVPLSSTCSNVVRVISRDDDNSIRFTFNHRTWSTNLESSDFVDQSYSVQTDQGPYVVVEASRPILVAILVGPSVGEDYQSCGPSMTIVPGVNQYMNSYRVNVPTGLSKAVISVIVPATQVSGLRLNNQPISSSSLYHVSLNGTVEEYYVVDVDVVNEAGDVLLSHADLFDFGAIFRGERANETFAFPLGMTLDLAEGNVVFVYSYYLVILFISYFDIVQMVCSI